MSSEILINFKTNPSFLYLFLPVSDQPPHWASTPLGTNTQALRKQGLAEPGFGCWPDRQTGWNWTKATLPVSKSSLPLLCRSGDPHRKVHARIQHGCVALDPRFLGDFVDLYDHRKRNGFALLKPQRPQRFGRAKKAVGILLYRIRNRASTSLSSFRS